MSDPSIPTSMRADRIRTLIPTTVTTTVTNSDRPSLHPLFTFTDSLLLFSISFYNTTLSRVLLSLIHVSTSLLPHCCYSCHCARLLSVLRCQTIVAVYGTVPVVDLVLWLQPLDLLSINVRRLFISLSTRRQLRNYALD